MIIQVDMSEQPKLHAKTLSNLVMQAYSLRKHGSRLLIRQNNLFHWVRLVFEVLRFAVCIRGQEELYDTTSVNSDGVLEIVRHCLTLIPIKALG